MDQHLDQYEFLSESKLPIKERLLKSVLKICGVIIWHQIHRYQLISQARSQKTLLPTRSGPWYQIIVSRYKMKSVPWYQMTLLPRYQIASVTSQVPDCISTQVSDKITSQIMFIRIHFRGTECVINLEERGSTKQYAHVDVDTYPGPAVQSVVDSSR